MSLPKWLKVKSMEKIAQDIEGYPLSEDTKNWPEEILDFIYVKYPFLKGYPAILKVEKRDVETKSAMMYIIVQISEGIKFSIIVMISNGSLLPIFPFIYNGKFYPLIEEAVQDIVSGASSIGTLTEEKVPLGKTPWHFMLEFLQNMMINKRASIASEIEKTQDLKWLETLMQNEKIATLLNVLVSKPKPVMRNVKTASVRNGVYQEIINGKIIKTEQISHLTHMTSTHMKLAEVNEAIASDKDIIVHNVDNVGTTKGRIIKGDKNAPVIENESYSVPTPDGHVDAIFLRTIYNHELYPSPKVEPAPAVEIGKSSPEVKVKNYQLFYNPGKEFFLLDNSVMLPLSEKKVERPPTHELGDADIGKQIYKVRQAETGMPGAPSIGGGIDDMGYLFSITEDDKETTYYFRNGKEENYGRRLVYSPAFADSKYDSYDMTGKKPEGFSFDLMSIPKYTPTATEVEKTAEEKMGAYLKLDKIDTPDSMERYKLMYQVNTKEGGSFMFGGIDSLGSIGAETEVADGKTVEGDRGLVEHELVRHGIDKVSIDELFTEADNEGSSTMFIPSAAIAPQDEVSEEAIKTANSIKKIVRAHLSFDKIAVLMSTKDKTISDIFSLHFLTPESVNAFLNEIPKLEGIVDHLCRYYIYRNVGLESITDRVDNKKLEEIIRGLYLVISDLKKYLFMFQNSGNLGDQSE